MPSIPARPTALAWQVFRGSEAVRRGPLTSHQLRSSAWIRLRRDVYADARLDRDHALACRAAALQLPADAAIAGPSAAYLHGVEHAAGFSDDVHVIVPRDAGLRSQRGLRVHSIAAPHVTSPSAGAAAPDPPRTGPARAAWETAVWLDPVRAVGIIDTLLARGLTTYAALADLARRNAERPGGRRARWVFDLADPAAPSPPESHLRVRLVLAGLPRPVAQHPFRLPNGLVLHPDLAWPDYRVAVEYDGHWHADADRLHADRRRLNQLVGAGWLVLHVTSRRLHGDFPGLLREVRSALAARGWRPSRLAG
ncbi:endonuclease domain-containing protein [Micromonospora echinaurantiaca]|uniref:endonuclease domain-containing protein n=1 Tax=Micromonospora echinaurantiaca TaxID=47857 RepID=UPI00372072B9